MPDFNRIIGVSSIAVFALLIDRFLKILATSEFFFTIPSPKPFISFQLFHNAKVAFGLPLTWSLFFSIVVICILIISIISAIHNFTQGLYQTSSGWILIFCGGSSNLFDRIVYGAVIDYIHIWPYAYLNIADIMIASGIILLVVTSKTTAKL